MWKNFFTPPFFVKLSDEIDNMMANQLYTNLDQFGGIEAASIGIYLDYTEYKYIEDNLGPVTKATIGYYVLSKLAEEIAEAIVYGVPGFVTDEVALKRMRVNKR